MSGKKYVYFFEKGKAEGNKDMKELLGGKGANLAEMCNIGIPVPPGFTISTEACVYFYKNGKYPEGLVEQVEDALRRLEAVNGKKFGDKKNPLLVSARSGARKSMPGMMDTVLNIGLNDEIAEEFSKNVENPRFVWDSYRRLIQMYGDVVMGLKPESEKEKDPFEVIIEELKDERKIKLDIEMTIDDLKLLVSRFKELIKNRLGREFPQDPKEQLFGAIDAVFNSWNNERAINYRRMEGIPDDWGTAVNIQTMVFGNRGSDCATGVAFTRDPATGKKVFFGEYLINAQGEDVVAGIRTPQQITKEGSIEWAKERGIPEEERVKKYPSLEETMPEIYKELFEIQKKLENHYKDMQDIEFTIENKKLYILQTRNGKRTGIAALNIAVDLVDEGLIDKEEAILRVDPSQHLEQVLKPIFDPGEKKKAKAEKRLVAKGLPAGPGAATGRVVFNTEDAISLKQKLAQDKTLKDDEKGVILVRYETSPEDIKGMEIADGILTARGGMTSHAAVVGRQMGKTCVVGCEDLEIDYHKGEIKVKDVVIKEGDFISIDGFTGEVFTGKIKTMPSEVLSVIDGLMTREESELYKKYERFMSWVSEYLKDFDVRTNADRPKHAAFARKLGAHGIGLCRTEHMFFEGERVTSMRKMILAETDEERKKALDELLPMQTEDFIGIFRAMDGYPVTIRTLDPPLHEFLPHDEDELKEFCEKTGIPEEKVREKIEDLKEMNPMLGFRGVRLGIRYPEITRMQATAIFEAAISCKKEGVDVHPEIMIPLVGTVQELSKQAEVVREVANSVMEKHGEKIDYKIGTMIEIPRAAITADEIARVAEFFSFGTNDLTQMTYGISRDDYGKFSKFYIDQGIWKKDPFQTLDTKGVGELIKIAVQKGRGTRENLKVGICGEHGGDPASIEFCHGVGLNYVSCSPPRVPVARLAAAISVIKSKNN